MKQSCTCGLAMRMNSTIAAAALEELRKHDNEAADRIVIMANQKSHKDWCGSAAKWLAQRKRPEQTIGVESLSIEKDSTTGDP